jgi:hypothetical protein
MRASAELKLRDALGRVGTCSVADLTSGSSSLEDDRSRLAGMLPDSPSAKDAAVRCWTVMGEPLKVFGSGAEMF